MAIIHNDKWQKMQIIKLKIKFNLINVCYLKFRI